MELNFGNNLKHLRKSRDLTQDDLALALGVSSQAVSKWECGYGYPDIMQLPVLANYFGITIDELLMNDEESKTTIRKQYLEKRDALETFEERVELAREYLRRYPDSVLYKVDLIGDMAQAIVGEPSLRGKYMPQMREIAEELLNTKYNNHAILNMTIACDEDELDKWLEMTSENLLFTRRGNLITRYEWMNDEEKVELHSGIEIVETLNLILDMRYPDGYGRAEGKARYQRGILSILDSLKIDGKLPDGWVLMYAYKQLVLSACLFGSGDSDEGWIEFDGAMEKFKYWFGLEDVPLELGGEIFRGLKVRRDWHKVVDKDGGEHFLHGTNGLSGYDREQLHDFLTDPRWAWFNSVREDPRFIAAVEWCRTESDT